MLNKNKFIGHSNHVSHKMATETVALLFLYKEKPRLEEVAVPRCPDAVLACPIHALATTKCGDLQER
jgi:hypothetical protein